MRHGMLEGARNWANKGRQMHIKQVPGSRRGKDKEGDKDKGADDDKKKGEKSEGEKNKEGEEEEEEEMKFKIPYLSSQDITPGK